MLSKTDQKTDLNNKKNSANRGWPNQNDLLGLFYLTAPITFNFDHKEYV